MSILFVYHVSSPDLPNKVLTHLEDIASTLAEQGVVFERLQASTPVKPGTGNEDVISAYRTPVDALMTERGHVSVEVISIDRDHLQKSEFRAGFLEEHHHGADEVRFFVAGRGLLNLHIGEYVFALLCEKHDLVSVPAGTRQWFDIGEQPHLVAIRLFKSAEGGVAKFTRDDIAQRFPEMED